MVRTDQHQQGFAAKRRRLVVVPVRRPVVAVLRDPRRQRVRPVVDVDEVPLEFGRQLCDERRAFEEGAEHAGEFRREHPEVRPWAEQLQLLRPEMICWQWLQRGGGLRPPPETGRRRHSSDTSHRHRHLNELFKRIGRREVAGGAVPNGARQDVDD